MYSPQSNYDFIAIRHATSVSIKKAYFHRLAAILEINMAVTSDMSKFGRGKFSDELFFYDALKIFTQLVVISSVWKLGLQRTVKRLCYIMPFDNIYSRFVSVHIDYKKLIILHFNVNSQSQVSNVT